MTDWRGTDVAPDRTHHLASGAPLYSARFLEVLKFHAPGLAPAVDERGATHIDVRGQAAYPQRYTRTFGFYEDRAAVCAADGWHHLLPDGAALYPERYAWCGNFQEGRCSARDADGRYLHLLPDGRRLSVSHWRYTGDFRDGAAVVQREDRLHGHIGRDGEPLHHRWFQDLDVFHKGYARARDPGGWMHVDRRGEPIYARRFAAVEPFYNGQARVERLDGGLEVVSERGETLVALRPGRSAFAELSADLVGTWRTDALAGAVAIGLADALPGTAPAIAQRLGLDPIRLRALLRGLVELGVAECTGDTWSLTARGAYLRADDPLTLADAAREYAGPLRALWSRLPEALRPGWAPPDVFGDVARDADRLIPHHRMLRSYARHDYPLVPHALGLRGDERVLDVGGGAGVLAGLLLDAQPGLEVHVLDRPEVLAQITDPRIHRVSADLFGAWPSEMDAVIFARVLHDWDDDRAAWLLRSARSVVRPGGRVFVVELLTSDDGAFGGLCDLHLLLATGGRERTEAEYTHLLTATGFTSLEVRPTGALPSVIVGVAG